MKKLFLFTPIILLFLISCNNNKIEIKGTIVNGEGKDLSFKELLVDGTLDIERVKLSKNGSFKFKAESEVPRFYYLILSPNNFITLLLNPGDKVEIKADVSDLKNAQITGSKESQQIQFLNKRLEKTKKELDSLSKQYAGLDKSGADEQNLTAINQQYSKLIGDLRDSSIAFILGNLDNMASIMVLYQKIDEENFVLYKNRDLQYIKLVSEALVKKYPESPHVKALMADKDNLLKRYDQLVTQKKIEELAKTKKVSGIPDITLPDTKGDSISLNSLTARYKLLCFWATWSQESIQQNIQLIDLYQKYHSKGFEVYMVSLDTKQDAWKESIQFDQLPWINVIDINGRTSYVAKIYNVRTLPTSYLINGDDDIVSVNPTNQEIINTLEYALK